MSYIHSQICIYFPVSVTVLALIAVIIFALVVVLLCTTIAVCSCHHRKQSVIISKSLCSTYMYVKLHLLTETEVLPPQQDVMMPVISNNPAYNKLVIVHNLKEAGCTDSNTKESPDYESIEEIIIKQKTKDNDNTIEGDYEPVECRS